MPAREISNEIEATSESEKSQKKSQHLRSVRSQKRNLKLNAMKNLKLKWRS